MSLWLEAAGRLTIAPQLMSTEVVGGFTGVILGIYATGNGSADFKSFDYQH